jgi:hypothetical protein
MKCKRTPNEGKKTRSIAIRSEYHKKFARLKPEDCDKLDKCIIMHNKLGCRITGLNPQDRINRSTVAAFAIDKEYERLKKLNKGVKKSGKN